MLDKNKPKYKIGEQEIDARLFRENLDNNVASYLDSLDWTPEEKNLFRQYYNIYSKNLESGRFSSDAFYTITDPFGELDDTKPILFNDDGTQYTPKTFDRVTDNAEKQRLLAKLAANESKLHSFNPSKKVATYAKLVGQELIKALKNSPTTSREKPKKFNQQAMLNGFQYYLPDAPAAYYNDLRIRESKGNFNRAQILRSYLVNAYTEFNEAGYDNETVKLWGPRFLSALDALGDNSFDDGDYSALYPLFNGSKFLDNYFSSTELSDLTPELQAALRAGEDADKTKKEQEELLAARTAAFEQAFSAYKSQHEYGLIGEADVDSNVGIIEDPENPLLSRAAIMAAMREAVFRIDDDNNDPTIIAPLIWMLWQYREDDNEPIRFRNFSEDQNAANLISLYTPIKINNALKNWWYFHYPGKDWAIIYNRATRQWYKMWAGFFKDSDAYGNVDQSLKSSNTTPRWQEGGSVSQDANDPLLLEIMGALLRHAGPSGKSKKTVNKEKVSAFSSNYDPDEKWSWEDDWLRAALAGLDTVSVFLPAGAPALIAGTAGTVAGTAADILDFRNGKLGWGNLALNAGTNLLGTAAAAVGIKGQKATKAGATFARLATPVISTLVSAGALGSMGHLILDTFHKKPTDWNKEDWKNVLWTAQFLISRKNLSNMKGRMKSVRADNEANNIIGIRTKHKGKFQDYTLSGEAGKQARSIIEDPNLTVQAKQEKLVPILEKVHGFKGNAADIHTVSDGGLHWRNPSTGRGYFGVLSPVTSDLTINTFEPNYGLSVRYWGKKERDLGKDFPTESPSATPKPPAEPAPKPEAPGSPTGTPNTPTGTPSTPPTTPTTTVLPALPPTPTPTPTPTAAPHPEYQDITSLYTPTHVSPPTGQRKTSDTQRSLKLKLTQIASEQLLEIFNKKLGLDVSGNRMFSFEGKEFSITPEELQSLKKYLAKLKVKPTTDGSVEALLTGWLRSINRLKSGGHILKFQQPSGPLPQLTAAQKDAAVALKGTAQQRTPPSTYADIDYSPQGWGQNRNWVDFDSATKSAWANDAAFKELGTAADQYFDAQGKLISNKRNRFALALYNTNAFKNYNTWLTTPGNNTLYGNLLNYFQHIYDALGTPDHGKQWVLKWALVGNDGKLTWKPNTLTTIQTPNYDFFGPGNILYKRMDNLPGTYHYTPDLTTPTPGNKTHNYVWNPTSNTWVEILSIDGLHPIIVDNAEDEYWIDGDYDTHTNKFYIRPDTTLAHPGEPEKHREVDVTPPASDTNPLGNILAGLGPHAIAYGRLRNLLWNNNRVADKAMAAEIPYLKDPVEKFRDVYGSLEEVNAGQRMAGQYNRIATAHPLTSDATTNLAFQLAALKQGNAAILEGLTKDNAMRRRTHELSIALDHENVDSRHQTAMENRLQQLKTVKNKNAIDLARLNQITLDWDIFGQSIEHELKTRYDERRADQEKLDLANANNTVMSKLDDYLKPNSPERLAYDKYNNGEELNEAEKKSLLRAIQLLQDAANVEYAKLRGLNYVSHPIRPLSPGSGITVSTVSSNKLGGLLEYYKSGGDMSEERIKNADRFMDSVKHLQKLNWKKLERLSKSMYNLPNKA